MKSILFKPESTPLQIAMVRRELVDGGAASVSLLEGERALLVFTDPSNELRLEHYQSLPGVEAVMESAEKNVRVAFDAPGEYLSSGDEGFLAIAGPCGIENETQISAIYSALAREGIRYVRGSAFKPRTSPHDYQGPGESGLVMAYDIASDYGLKLVTEVVDPRDIEFVARYAAMIQIGTRSMQNFPLLREAGATGIPILLKRGMSATVEEWIGAGEHALCSGAKTIIFCERGMRTFESITRNTLDLLGAAALKEKTRMPVIADPSHAAGRRSLVVQGALAAVAAGLNGFMVEVHNDPASAKSDAAQALPLEDFSRLMALARNVRAAIAEEIFG